MQSLYDTQLKNSHGNAILHDNEPLTIRKALLTALDQPGVRLAPDSVLIAGTLAESIASGAGGMPEKAGVEVLRACVLSAFAK